jgi:hypothetical protein
MTMPQYGQPAPAAPKSKAKGRAGLNCGILVLLAVIGVTAAAMTSKGAPTASSAAAAPPAAATTLLTLKGTGTKTTAQFTTGSNWTVGYTYDCARLAGNFTGNFTVTDETKMLLVDEIKLKGSGSSPQYAAGTHHLQINSECDWTITVTG